LQLVTSFHTKHKSVASPLTSLFTAERIPYIPRACYLISESIGLTY